DGDLGVRRHLERVGLARDREGQQLRGDLTGEALRGRTDDVDLVDTVDLDRTTEQLDAGDLRGGLHLHTVGAVRRRHLRGGDRADLEDAGDVDARHSVGPRVVERGAAEVGGAGEVRRHGRTDQVRLRASG